MSGITAQGRLAARPTYASVRYYLRTLLAPGMARFRRAIDDMVAGIEIYAMVESGCMLAAAAFGLAFIGASIALNR